MDADWIALTAAACWGTASICVAQGTARQSTDNGAFISILLTMLLAAAVWWSRGSGWRPQLLDFAGLAWFVVAGTLTIFLGRVLFHSSVQMLGAVRSTSIKRMTPLFTVVMGLVLLEERLQLSDVLGIVMIFGGFAMLINEDRRRGQGVGAYVKPAKSVGQSWISLGIVYGALSALSYALGNVARKFGLAHIPDPAWGALIGAMTGVALYLLAALRWRSFRAAVTSSLKLFNMWLWIAGVLASLGQILYFFAIDMGSLTRATIIVSMDVFVTILIAGLLFGKRERINASVVLASLLGVFGALCIFLRPLPG